MIDANHSTAGKIEAGTYVKKTSTAKKVWIARGWCRVNRMYQFDDANDISNCFYATSYKKLFVNFEY